MGFVLSSSSCPTSRWVVDVPDGCNGRRADEWNTGPHHQHLAIHLHRLSLGMLHRRTLTGSVVDTGACDPAHTVKYLNKTMAGVSTLCTANSRRVDAAVVDQVSIRVQFDQRLPRSISGVARTLWRRIDSAPSESTALCALQALDDKRFLALPHTATNLGAVGGRAAGPSLTANTTSLR